MLIHTLLFAQQGWKNAWVALSMFGIGIIVSRLLFAGGIARRGGLTMARIFFTIEAAGLLLIWLAQAPMIAMSGSFVAGFGFAIIFPALGLIVVDLMPPQNRGTAISIYSMFTDLSLCLTGPIAGMLAAKISFAAPFLFGAIGACISLALTLALRPVTDLERGGHDKADLPKMIVSENSILPARLESD
jgi:predicted MFS family arabinose efflux permease